MSNLKAKVLAYIATHKWAALVGVIVGALANAFL